MASQNISQWIPLKTRMFTCSFDSDTGYLRRVKSAGAEVTRAIYGAVRDKNWATVEPRLNVERLEQTDDFFCLEFTARCDQAPISFLWKGTIQGQKGKWPLDLPLGKSGAPSPNRRTRNSGSGAAAPDYRRDKCVRR